MLDTVKRTQPVRKKTIVDNTIAHDNNYRSYQENNRLVLNKEDQLFGEGGILRINSKLFIFNLRFCFK